MQNVAALVDTPKGQAGRPSRALTAEQAAILLDAARSARLGTYVVLCLMTGIRTEEARALRWEHVDLDAGHRRLALGPAWRRDQDREIEAHSRATGCSSKGTARAPGASG